MVVARMAAHVRLAVPAGQRRYVARLLSQPSAAVRTRAICIARARSRLNPAHVCDSEGEVYLQSLLAEVAGSGWGCM